MGKTKDVGRILGVVVAVVKVSKMAVKEVLEIEVAILEVICVEEVLPFEALLAIGMAICWERQRQAFVISFTLRPGMGERCLGL